MNKANAQHLAAPSCRPEFIRLPRVGEKDPIFGLSRSFLNNLILPSQANGFYAPIRSISIRKRNASRGVRLIVVASALAYFEKLAAEQAQQEEINQHFPVDIGEMPTKKPISGVGNNVAPETSSTTKPGDAQ